jgi:hypothetical protein
VPCSFHDSVIGNIVWYSEETCTCTRPTFRALHLFISNDTPLRRPRVGTRASEYPQLPSLLCEVVIDWEGTHVYSATSQHSVQVLVRRACMLAGRCMTGVAQRPDTCIGDAWCPAYESLSRCHGMVKVAKATREPWGNWCGWTRL